MAISYLLANWLFEDVGPLYQSYTQVTTSLRTAVTN